MLESLVLSIFKDMALNKNIQGFTVYRGRNTDPETKSQAATFIGQENKKKKLAKEPEKEQLVKWKENRKCAILKVRKCLRDLSILTNKVKMEM